MPHSPNTEEGEIRLIARAQTGDEDALEILYREHERRAYNLALRMLGDPWSAADVAQDAFIKAFSSLGRFREDAKFSTWLHRIVVNTAYDYLSLIHISEPTRLRRISYAVFCLKKKKKK